MQECEHEIRDDKRQKKHNNLTCGCECLTAMELNEKKKFVFLMRARNIKEQIKTEN